MAVVVLKRSLNWKGRPGSRRHASGSGGVILPLILAAGDFGRTFAAINIVA